MVRMILKALLVLGFLTCSEGVPAQAQDQPVPVSRSLAEAIYLLETWIQTVLDYDRLPGLSLAVVHDQEIAYAGGFGYADVGAGIPATVDTRYSICSISKLLTAIAIMQLRDAGKLRLEDPVSRHLAWFKPRLPDPEALPPTLGDLLHHTGGLPCEPDPARWTGPKRLRITKEELIERAAEVKMSYPANTQHNYSNLGYALLGAVVSAVSGMTYEDYVASEILSPIGLLATAPNTLDGAPAGILATGYGRSGRKDGRPLLPVLPWDAMTPAGGYASTVRDLARFAMWQFRVLDGEQAGVLGGMTLREMQSPQWSDPAWGYGFVIWHLDGRAIIGHYGGCPGYKSHIILCPEEKIAVVAMLNATDAPQFTIALETYRILAPALTSIREQPDVGTTQQWSEYVGSYTADCAWSDAEVFEWGGALSVLWVPTPSPLDNMIRLHPIERGVFRQVKADGTLGKHYVFGLDDDGAVIGMKFNNNVLLKTPR